MAAACTPSPVPSALRRSSRAIAIGLVVLAPAGAHGEPAPQAPYDPPQAPPSATPRTGYGHAGRFELGGAGGVSVASDVRDVRVAPAIGWFVAERFELSAIASVAHLKAGAQSATLWSTLLEPSYHVALDDRTFGVLGMGIGVAYQRRLGTGLAVAPRIGLEFVVGRALVITPALAYDYVTHRALDDGDVAVAGVTSALRLQLGLAASW